MAEEIIWILVLDAEGHCAGRYLVDAFARLPPVATPGYIAALVAELIAHQVDVLLPGIDSEIAVLSAARLQFKACPTAIVLAPTALVDAAQDKLATAIFLSERGIAIPPTCDADSPGTLPPFPIIAKPRRGNGARGLVSLSNQADLQAFNRERRANYCLQQEVAGPEVTIALLYDRTGVLRDAMAMERTLEGGRTVRAEVVNSPALDALIARFGDRVPGAGAVNVQARLDPALGPLVFEVNARLSGSTAMRVAVGFNDPLRLARHFGRGEPIARAVVRPATVYRYSSVLVVAQ